MSDHLEIIKAAVMDETNFRKLTLLNKLRDDGSPWVKVVVRPVFVKRKRMFQFSYFDVRKDITKNYPPDDILDRLDGVLDIPFSRIELQGVIEDLDIKIDRKGNANIRRTSHAAKKLNLAHDHTKATALSAEDAFLSAIGVTDQSGKVRPGMQAKFRQINEFLRIIGQVLPAKDRPIHIIDCGCGSAHLTFAAYHFLRHKLNLSVELTGIDINSELIEKNIALRDELGWKEINFHQSTIADFNPSNSPDIVLSLHACDTATDEAIARGILWKSKAILAAPCCQHELHHQLNSPIFEPVTRHGILNERLADILTDAFRAQILQIMGYSAQVIEFVDPEHSGKNLMIRAEHGLTPGSPTRIKKYQGLKEFWNVTPILEKMLGESFRT